MNYKAIIDKLFELKEREDKIDETLKGFITAINPDIHTPFFEYGWVDAFLSAIQITNREIHDDLSYFVYDVQLMKGKGLIKVEWKEYTFETKEKMIHYLEKEYPIKK